MAFRELGDPAAALPLLEQSLTILESALDPTHPDVAIARDNLVLVLGDMGNPEVARPLLERPPD
jgi:hypothetical protein